MDNTGDLASSPKCNDRAKLSVIPEVSKECSDSLDVSVHSDENDPIEDMINYYSRFGWQIYTLDDFKKQEAPIWETYNCQNEDIKDNTGKAPWMTDGVIIKFNKDNSYVREAINRDRFMKPIEFYKDQAVKMLKQIVDADYDKWKNTPITAEDIFPRGSTMKGTKGATAEMRKRTLAIFAMRATGSSWHTDPRGRFLNTYRPICIDSGASIHVVGDASILQGLRPIPDDDAQWVTLPDGSHYRIGTIEIEGFSIPNVHFVDGLETNLISVGRLDKDHGLCCQFSNRECKIMKPDGTLVGKALQRENGLYVLEELKVPRQEE